MMKFWWPKWGGCLSEAKPRKHLESNMTNRTVTRLLPAFVCCAIIPFTLGGCPPTNNPGGGGNGPPLSSEQRVAAFDQMHQVIEAIGLDGDPNKVNQLVTQLRTMPVFDLVEAEDGVVTARFTDGQVIMIFNNRPSLDLPSTTPRKKVADGPSAADGHGSKPDEPRRSDPIKSNRIPDSKSAVLINAMGTEYCDPTPEIGEWLSQAGYQVERNDGRIEDLRTSVRDVGVLYYSGHGSVLPDSVVPKNLPAAPPGTRHFGLWTRTQATQAVIDFLKVDLDAGDVIYGDAETDRVQGSADCLVKKGAKAKRETHIIITESFIRKYWKCKKGALMYIDACHSAQADSCLPAICTEVGDNKVGAGVFLGWSALTLDQFSTPTALFFFDRILGANQYEPINSPKQRPFSTSKVLAGMKGVVRNGLPMDTSDSYKNFWLDLFQIPTTPPPEDPNKPFVAKLLAKFADDTEDVLLLPAIESMTVAEFPGSKLRIKGHFPDKPCSVTVGGAAATVQSQTASLIEAGISSSANGPVEVSADGRTSPPRRLAQWNLNLRRLFMDYPTQASTDCPSCFWEGNIQYTFRGDTAGVRLLPEGLVLPPNFTGGASSGSMSVTNAGGTYSIGQGTSITLAPYANPSPATFTGTCVGFNPPNEHYLGACFFFEGAQNRVLFSPTIFAEYITRNYHGGQFDGIIDPYQVTYSGNIVGNELVLPLSPNFNISAGHKATGPNSYFEWDAAVATSPAEPGDSR